MKKRVTTEDLEDLTTRSNELSMELILMHNKIQRGECDVLMTPSHYLRIIANLAMWANQFSIALIEVLDKQAKDERNGRIPG